MPRVRNQLKPVGHKYLDYRVTNQIGHCKTNI